MQEDPIGFAARGALWLMLEIAGPPLLAMLVIGLAVSVFQAITQIQEASLAFLPKLAVLAVILLLFGTSMTGALTRYGEALFDQAIALGGAP
ncbi:MAG: flagellar biosynthetic protein FliQ [Acetobacteraceae bacterium]|nr:flagellar biosynthetic protein FliQ [Acetobacteraceae bacterium]